MREAKGLWVRAERTPENLQVKREQRAELCAKVRTLTMAKAGGAAALHTHGWYSLQGCPGTAHTAQESTQQSPFLLGPAGKERQGCENPASSAGGRKITSVGRDLSLGKVSAY